jgi:hypothetical protein
VSLKSGSYILDGCRNSEYYFVTHELYKKFKSQCYNVSEDSHACASQIANGCPARVDLSRGGGLIAFKG